MAQPLFPNLKPSLAKSGEWPGFLFIGLKWRIRNFSGKNLVDMVHINLDMLYIKKTIPPSNILAHIGELVHTRVVVAKS
jgi:hypothetical protein